MLQADSKFGTQKPRTGVVMGFNKYFTVELIFYVIQQFLKPGLRFPYAA
jgi:hypothetical protein